MRLGDTLFTAIDFESAGTAPGRTDEPVQIAMASMKGDHLLKEDFFVSYLKIDRPVTWAAQKVHGITSMHLEGAPRLLELWPTVKSKMDGAVVVAHGVGTEKRFLRAFPFHGFGPWLDTLTLARSVCPGLTDYSISSIIEALGLKPILDGLCPGLPWHHALYDSVACLVFLQRILREPGMLDRDLDSLIK